MAESSTFAQRLKTIRENAGLSQYALAKKTGLSKQGLSRLELGEREPTWQTVQALVLALGVDCKAFIDESFTLPDEEPSKPRGRPRKAEEPAVEEPPAGKPKPRKKKGG
jgi:transcriptional regulator with XRE-family HTH domain